MKVADLIGRLTQVIAAHQEGCFSSDPKMRAHRANCTALTELASIIEENPVRVRPARPKCNMQHFPPFSPPPIVREVVVKPPTWINRDGEEVIIESMTAAHLNNTIEFVRRVRTERGEAALAALEAEHERRVRREMAQAEAFQARCKEADYF